MSPQGIMVPASAVQQGSVTVTTGNAPQVIAGTPSVVKMPTVLTSHAFYLKIGGLPIHWQLKTLST